MKTRMREYVNLQVCWTKLKLSFSELEELLFKQS